MSKSEEKLKAFELRREGKSIKEISGIVGVSKDTVSIWCRELVLTKEEEENLRRLMWESGQRGRMIGAKMNKDKRMERIRAAQEEAVEKIREISDNELFWVGLGLYWGEGTKSDGSALAFSNSDPRAIRLMIRWFSECLKVSNEDFAPRVFISDIHHDREDIILNFWAQELGMPRGQFKKTIFLNKGKKIYENQEVYYGVLALRIAKGTALRHKILAYIARVSEVAI